MITKNLLLKASTFILSILIFTSCGKSAQEIKNAEDTVTLLESFDSYKENYIKLRNFELPVEIKELPRIKVLKNFKELEPYVASYTIRYLNDSMKHVNAPIGSEEKIFVLPKEVFFMNAEDLKRNKNRVISTKMMALIDPIIEGAEWKFQSDTIKYAAEILSFLNTMTKAKYIAIDHIEVEKEPIIVRRTFENQIRFGKLYLVDIDKAKVTDSKIYVSSGDSEEFNSVEPHKILKHLKRKSEKLHRQTINYMLYEQPFFVSI